MTTKNSINVGGLIKNMLDSGFDTNDCIGELIDNSLGANATNIKIHLLDTLNELKNVILFVDNGIGMDQTELEKCYVLHNRQDANDERAGYFGIGSKHAKIHFTQHKYFSKTISKKNEPQSQLFEIKADWKTAVENNHYNPIPHEITKSGEEIWNKYCINNNGTIDIIPCDEILYKNIKLNINEIIELFGQRYYLYINNCSISFIIDDIEYTVKSLDPIQWDLVPENLRKEIIIDVRKDNNSDKLYCYFDSPRKKNSKVYLDTYNGKSKLVQNDNNDYLNNTVIKGTIIVKSVYMKEWKIDKTNDDDEIEDDDDTVETNNTDKIKRKYNLKMGGRYIQRNKKLIDHFKIPYPNSGDNAKRDYIALSRHLIKFNSNLDKEFQVQINKSHIKENDINNHIYETIKYLNKKFSENIYDTVHKKELKQVPVKSEPKPDIVKQEPKPDIVKQEPKPDIVKLEPKPDIVKPEPKPDIVKQILTNEPLPLKVLGGKQSTIEPQLRLKYDSTKITLYENNKELFIFKTLNANKLGPMFYDHLKNLKKDIFIKFFDDYIKLYSKYKIN